MFLARVGQKFTNAQRDGPTKDNILIFLDGPALARRGLCHNPLAASHMFQRLMTRGT